MSDLESKKVDYIVMIVGAYARDNQLPMKEALVRLLDCGGIDALDEFYDIEHTLPVSSTVEGLNALYARSVA